MPQFKYVAINQSGKKMNQTMPAASRDEVLAYLAQQHLVPVEVTEVTKIARSSHSLKTNEKVFFTQNVAVLLASGISLGEALAIIANDSPNKKSAQFYESIRVELEKGTPLSKALSNYPGTFDSIYISLVEAGENSGELASVMDNLAKGIEKDARTVHQIKGAMIYPGIIFGTLVIMGIGIVFFVLPKITQVFESLDVVLPITTQLLVNFGRFVTQHPVLFLSLTLAFFIALGGIWSVKRVRQKLAHLSMRLPLIRDLIRNLDLTRLSSTLSLLLSAGVPIQNALSIASGTITNPRLAKEFKQVSEKLATGTSLGAALSQTGLPKTFIALVAVGERSGKISTIFESLANHYSELFDTSVKNFTGAIEPILTLFVGVVVGGVVITIMLPIYQFVGNLQTLAK